MPLILEIMVVSTVIRLLGLVQPFVFQTIIDRVLPFQREATLGLVIVVLALATVFSAALDSVGDYLAGHMGNRLTAELGQRIFRHVLNLPLRFMQDWRVGETIARIGEIETVRGFLTGTISGVALDAIFATVYVAALLTISPSLTLIVVTMLPLQVVAFSVLGPFVRQRMQQSFLAGSRHQSRMVEAFGGPATIKALVTEEVHVGRFQETLEASLDADFRVVKLNIVNRLIGELLGSGSVILIIYFGSRLVFENTITLGELVAFHLLSEKISGPVFSLSRTWEQWQGLKIARLRLGDFLNTPSELDAAKPRLKVIGPLRIKASNVSFGYMPDYPVIRDMSLQIEPGRPTIVIGPSGCGKSTFGMLLSGLFQPDQGRIEVNEHVLSDCDPRSVRKEIVYQPQEPVLFSGSILANLRMARTDVSDEDIRRALADSASDLFIPLLSNGIHTEVGERGSHLSGGQRQRIALARTLLVDAQALILDEPTSALDEHASAVVVDTLRRLALQKALVVITHKPNLLGEDVNIVDFTALQPQSRFRAMDPALA